MFLFFIPSSEFQTLFLTAFLFSVAFAHVADGGAHGGLCCCCVHMFGASWQKYCCGAQILQLLFSSNFFFCFVYSFEVVSSEPSVSVEGRLSSILQIRDMMLFCFLLPLHTFQPPHAAFFPPLSEPISLSSFYLITPPFAHSSTVCLKWPHLPPLILFVPHPTFSISPLALSFMTCICPSSVYFVLKFNNFFTPFISSSSFFLPFQLFLLLPPTHLKILICLPFGHLTPFCFVFWFTLHPSFACLAHSCCIHSYFHSCRLFHYFQNWSPSLLIFNRNFEINKPM